MVTNTTTFCTFIWLHSQCKYKTELQSWAEILLLHDSPIPFHISFQACNDRISWGLITWNSTCTSRHNFLIFSAFKTFLSTKYLSYRPILRTDKISFTHKRPNWKFQNTKILLTMQTPILPPQVAVLFPKEARLLSKNLTFKGTKKR